MKRNFHQRAKLIKTIDPKSYNLNSRIILEDCGNNKIAILKNRSSRIIMTDGIKILEIAKKIQNQDKSKSIFLKTNAPICSKTTEFLQKNKVEIIFTDF